MMLLAARNLHFVAFRQIIGLFLLRIHAHMPYMQCLAVPGFLHHAQLLESSYKGLHNPLERMCTVWPIQGLSF